MNTPVACAHNRTKMGAQGKADHRHALTDDAASAAFPACGLVKRSGGRTPTVLADGAYHSGPVYAAIRAARPMQSPPTIVIPPQLQSIRAARWGGPKLD